MQLVMSASEILRRLGSRLGPYLVLEFLLPGGTVLALLLFLYERRKLQSGALIPGYRGALDRHSLRACREARSGVRSVRPR
jgi:hypothetical protein